MSLVRRPGNRQLVTNVLNAGYQGYKYGKSVEPYVREFRQKFNDVMVGNKRKSVAVNGSARKKQNTSKAKTKAHHGSRSTTGQNKLAQRATMTKAGHVKVRNNKKKKLAPKFVKAVKQAMDSDKAYGEYVVTRQGVIGNFQARNSSLGPAIATGNIGAYAAQLLVYGPQSFTYPLNAISWWNGMTRRDGAIDGFNVGNTIAAGDDWNFFSPMRFLDAASVLWNQKVIGSDYTLAAGNFATLAQNPTAFPGLTPGFKFDIINSFVTFEVKNNTQRAMIVKFYHLTPKLAYPDDLPLQSLRESVTNSLNDNKIRVGAVNTENQLMTDPALRLKVLEGFNQMWDYQIIDVKIAPGETCKHSLQGPRNTEYVSNKLYTSGDEKNRFLKKGWSVSVMASVLNDQEIGISASRFVVGRPIAATTFDATATLSQLKNPISIETKEHYKLRVPNMKTFVSNVVAGQVQAENLNRTIYAYQNTPVRRDATEAAALAYTSWDEENPAAPIPSSDVN